MAAHTRPPPSQQQQLYAIPLDGQQGESDDCDGIQIEDRPPGTLVYDTASSNLFVTLSPKNEGQKRPTLRTTPGHASDSNLTWNDTFAAPSEHQSDQQQNRWDEYLTVKRTMESQPGNPRENYYKATGAAPLRPQRSDDRFWRGLNIVTFVMAFVGLVLVLVHMAKGDAGSTASGGVEASSVRGLSAWQEEVSRNLTAVQSDLATLNTSMWSAFLTSKGLIY